MLVDLTVPSATSASTTSSSVSPPTSSRSWGDCGGPRHQSHPEIRTRMMDRLWAGWRSEYIETIAGGDAGSRGGESVFTRILNSGLRDEETHIVWRGDRT